MKLKLDLELDYLMQLQQLFLQHIPSMQVLAYGSRITGKSHQGSDLDLVVKNPDFPKSPQKNLSALRSAIADSNIPIIVEIWDWATIPDDFQQQIAFANIQIWPVSTTT